MMRRRGLYGPQYEHDACGVGFAARINGEKRHDIIEQGITILNNLEHRGATGGDNKTGDGAGMLIQIPHRFFSKCVDFSLPEPGKYGVGFIFMPKTGIKDAESLTQEAFEDEGFRVLGWREVPVKPECLGETAMESMPTFRQVFVTHDQIEGDELETKLYPIRRVIENRGAEKGWSIQDFYISSLSSKTVVYKGMLVAPQFKEFYPDLSDTDMESAIALVHQRYSTNTFPSWPLAQPFRSIAHNGEINTLKRNTNAMKARENSLESKVFGDDIKKLLPVIQENVSDSAAFDNVFELLTKAGRSPQHAIMMMIPEAFGSRYHISTDKRAFYEYHASIMEPWDGPAAVAFSNGEIIGATLDRNGLRPGRYTVTEDGLVVMASETGVLDIDPSTVVEKGRLAPGRMFIVDTVNHRFMHDNEIKSAVSRQKPYRSWIDNNRILLRGLQNMPEA
ncbi:MAG: glutamate synthase subunit alpha, partial [Chitinivibrionales bacterium]